MLPTTLLHRGLLILMLVTGLGSCVTPSIPIPPPAPVIATLPVMRHEFRELFVV